MNEKIILIGGSKGGVGKSMVCASLLDYFEQKKTDVLVIETDTSNPDIYKMYESIYQVETLDLDTKDGWIDLVNLAESNPQKPIVINTAARNIIGVTEHGLTLQTTLRDLERELFTLWVINRQRDSLELLSYYRDLFPDRIHVFMNLYFGDSHKFELYQKSKIKKEVEDAGGKSVFFPDLADRVTDAINIERIPISKAMNNMPLGNKAELRRWRDECTLIFEDLEF